MALIRNIVHLFSISCFLCIGGCVSNNTEPDDDSTKTEANKSGFFVLNEGNYTRGNASLTFISFDGTIISDAFTSANNRALGDDASDMVLYGGKGYLVVRNSQRIEVISLQDNKSAGTLQIPGTKSPNKLLIVDGTRAYVSNLYDNSITKFDPGTLTITKDRIPVGKNPAGLATANGKVYVCNSGWGQDSTVSVIDIAKDSIIKTIIVGLQPSEIGLDADGELIVKCDGLSDWYNPANSKPGSIAVINPSVDTVVARVQIPLMAYGNPGKMTISSKGYALICTKTNLSKVNTSTNVLSNAFSVGYEAYAAAIDDVTDLVYVADVKDYVQPGVITSYSTMNGSKQQTYTVGIIPGKIVIKR